MSITIRHDGGALKICEFEGFVGPKIPWVSLRYTGGAGLYRFSLNNGRGDKSQGISNWTLLLEDLEKLREQAAIGKLATFKRIPYREGPVPIVELPKRRSYRSKPQTKQLSMWDLK
jgi:hypothetical protein